MNFDGLKLALKPGERQWSAAQNRMFAREGRRLAKHIAEEREPGMNLPPGYMDPFMQKNLPSAFPPAMPGASREGTLVHISEVRRLIGKMLASLTRRSILHDQSKLEAPEVEHFDRAHDRLAECAYGSEEYWAGLADLQPALTHHYAVNNHHPEHYSDGIRGMCLMDLAEMLCDWLAACQRSPGGDILRSIEMNQQRFGYSDELKQILLNTVPLLAE